jgi:xylose isomerase
MRVTMIGVSAAAILTSVTVLAGVAAAEDTALPTARYIGATTGNSERDTFAYAAADLERKEVTPLLTDAAAYVGLRTGQDERDTFAHTELRSR